jgi:hypothetical protein
LAIQDSTSDYVNLKHKTIIVSRRYKTEKALNNAHKRRTYMGLTQVCRLLREEFAPLYLRARKSCLLPQSLGQYLTTFAVDGELRILGDALMKSKRCPSVDGGCNLLPVLKLLSQENIRMRFKKASDPWWDWTASTAIAILYRYHESEAPSLSDIGITHISFAHLPISEVYLSEEDPTHRLRVVNVILKPQVCECMTENQKKKHARTMLFATSLSLMNELLIRVRCGNWETLWRAGRNDPINLFNCSIFVPDKKETAGGLFHHI